MAGQPDKGPLYPSLVEYQRELEAELEAGVQGMQVGMQAMQVGMQVMQATLAEITTDSKNVNIQAITKNSNGNVFMNVSGAMPNAVTSQKTTVKAKSRLTTAASKLDLRAANKLIERIGWSGIFIAFATFILCNYVDFDRVNILWVSLFFVPALYLIASTALLVGHWLKFWPFHLLYNLIDIVIIVYLVFITFYFSIYFVETTYNSWTPFYKNNFAGKLLVIAIAHLFATFHVILSAITANVALRVVKFSVPSHTVAYTEHESITIEGNGNVHF